MNNRQPWLYPAVLLAGMLALHTAHAVDSGSTGADGALAPVADVAIGLPPGGILNYTTINIPANVTVTFFSDASNAPAVVLVQGDAVIDGSIDVSGKDGFAASGAGRQGGPGGFDGGRGGAPSTNGGNGYGPGGGVGGIATGPSLSSECGGTGGGFALAGGVSISACSGTPGGNAYGSERLVPIIGGSGGGGGRNSLTTLQAASGGGGGGALLLAVSGTLTLNGTILATGGRGGDSVAERAAGGGGSGGAVRIVTTTLAGSGSIDVTGGAGGAAFFGSAFPGGAGSFGRMHLEAETVLGSIASVPAGLVRLQAPSDIFPANLPVIRITTVDGIPVPSQPNGVDDVVLPSGIVNPVTVEFTASNVPLGTLIQLTMTPQTGATVTTLSDALTGTVQSSTASASIDLPQGSSVLSAAVSFTITAANGNLMDSFSHLAAGEPVERVEVVTTVGRGSNTRFITKSGKVYTWPSNAVALY